MKWTNWALLLTGLLSANAMADSCWTLTGMKGKTAFSDDNYRITDDGMSKSTFVLHINKKAPSIELLNGLGAYDGGQTLMASEEMLIYLGNAGGTTAEVWSVDPGKGVGYMTQSRSGFGQFNKAALFVGRAVPGC